VWRTWWTLPIGTYLGLRPQWLLVRTLWGWGRLRLAASVRCLGGRSVRPLESEDVLKPSSWIRVDGATEGIFPRRRKRRAGCAAKREVIREVEDGIFAPPTMPQTIKVRRVV
jgi:hypothetical protein